MDMAMFSKSSDARAYGTVDGGQLEIDLIFRLLAVWLIQTI
jgi:xanthine/CO dehydrogenase XdhC/CoxF family maturation factor